MKEKIILWAIAVQIIPLHGTDLTITPEEAQAIGQKIWHNECNGTQEGLTTWNQGEEFASLGIGHFIWYTAHKKMPFTETFPSLIKYLNTKNGKAVPPWLKKSIKTGCPWKNRVEFIAAQQSKRMLELRELLMHSIDLQTKFMINRFIAMMQSDAMKKRLTKQETANLTAMTQTAQGLYALIDYVNFKGEGLSECPKDYGVNWGLLQVFKAMDATQSPTQAVQEFAKAAKKVLANRVAHAPPQRNEQRWIPGWFKRIDTYTK